jgi:hypothetical protein
VYLVFYLAILSPIPFSNLLFMKERERKKKKEEEEER